MQTTSLIAGIDVGGTNVRCALATLDAPGEMIAHRAAPTPDVVGPEPLLDFVETTLRDCLRDAGCDDGALGGVAVAMPGVTDADAGIVYTVSNLRGWCDVPLADLLHRRFGAPSAVENDVKAAALGEYRFGAGAGYRSLVYMTISTGVAAGIVLDGRVWRGHHHAAGELGYMIPEPKHIGKDWEGIGCLELTSAGVGLGRAWADHAGGDASPARAVEVFEAAAAGDEAAAAIIRRAADYLAQAVVAVGAIVDPEVIVLGGSIAEHQPRVFEHIREVVAATLPFPPEVRYATLRGDAPIVGALVLAHRKAMGA